MGPPVPVTAKRDVSAPAASSRTDAARQRDRRSAPSHTTRAPLEAAAMEHVEWASPTSIRARSRPSNLHSYLRSNASFPPSAAPSPRPLRRSTDRGSVSSGGSTGVASPKQLRAGGVRSQSTRATQTSTTDFLITSRSQGDSSDAITLGIYGDIPQMSLDTVNYLIHALEERRHYLLRGGAKPAPASDASSSSSEPQMEPTAMERTNSRYFTSNTETNDTPGHNDDDVPSTSRVRSRSYEALAKLEQILEARHQQLMQDGALDGPAMLSLHGPAGADLTDEIRKLQQSFLMEARGQR